MQQISLIILLALFCWAGWINNDSLAAQAPPAGAREVSTATEHYWVIDVDGSEKKHGSYSRLHSDGSKLVSGNYLFGEKDGQWIFRSKAGEIIKEESWNKGKRDGRWAEWFANGKKAYEGEYKQGVPVGMHREWHMDGARKAEIEHQAKGNDVTAVKKTWHPNGKAYTQYEMLNGKMHGAYTSWYLNGQVQVKSAYDGGQRHGKYQEWYENGQPKSEVTYDQGRKTGQCKEWFDNGRKKSEGAYTDGKDGTWTTWDKSGLVVSQRRYKAGKLVKE